MPRRVVFVVYPEIQSLDLSGPVEVFAAANREHGADEYLLEVVSIDGEGVRTASGLRFDVDQAIGGVRGRIDTLVVVGGEGTTLALSDAGLVRAIQGLAGRATRVTSVCSGAFLLAEAGLLDGRRATTHWSYCEALAKRYPRVQVDPDPIFVRDGNVATSAGVTAGMDLALALVEDDLGRATALAVARRLVLFLRRPGSQSQFSAQLAGQIAERNPLRDAQHHIAEHPDADLSVGGPCAPRRDERAEFRAVLPRRDRHDARALRRTDARRNSPSTPRGDRPQRECCRPSIRVRHGRDHAPCLPSHRACVAERLPAAIRRFVLAHLT